MQKSIIPSLCALLSLGMFATGSHAATYEINLGPQAKLDLVISKFRIWIPDDVKDIRGMFVLTPGKNLDGRAEAGSAEWQALGTKHHFGIMAVYLKDDDNNTGYQFQSEVSDLLEKALKKGAAESKHEELEFVPLALWGHSAGANVSRTYAQNHSHRTLVIGLSKATAGGPDSFGGGTDIPVLLTTGMKEKSDWRTNSEKSFEQQRKYGAPWALAVNAAEGHEIGSTLQVVLPFLDECITLRLGPVKTTPSGTAVKPPAELGKIKDTDGWLGNPRTLDISSYKTYMGNRREACWFPGEQSAKAWKSYLRAGKS